MALAPAILETDSRWTLDLGAGVIIEASEDPASPVLDRFFAGYDKAFVLPDEREEIEGFRICLAQNARHRRRFSRVHSELVLVARDADDGTILGGANFLATSMASTPAVAVALNYLFVDRNARGRGLSRRLLVAVGRLAHRAVGLADETQLPAIFIELNDPLLMSEEAYAIDTQHSGTDQIERMRIWDRLGARLVNFPYVQPPLSADQEPDASLAFAAIDMPGEAVSARFLHDQLESFFGISVLKGGDPQSDPTARRQLDSLRAMAAAGETVSLLPLGPVLDRLRRNPDWPRGTPLRQLAETL